MTHAEWLSAHMYFDGDLFDLPCDRVLRAIVWPLVRTLRNKGAVQSTFFVRYADPGRHIRLRMLTSVGATSKVRDAVEREWHSRSGTAAGAKLGELRWVHYDPEMQRYGGAHAMPCIERLFEASSTMTSRLLTLQVIRDRAQRLGIAMFTTLVFLSIFLESRGRVAVFARRHASLYLRGHLLGPSGLHRTELEQTTHASVRSQRTRIKAVLDSLEGGGPLPRSVSPFAREAMASRVALQRLQGTRKLCLQDVVVSDWASATQPLAESIVHMTYNRLGITRFEEALLAQVLCECLCG